MHRLFLDQNVLIEIAHLLRQEGHEVVHAAEANLDQREDDALFRWAVERGMTIITFDIDFAERAYWRREHHHGIVRLKLEPQTPPHVLPVPRRFLASWSPEKLEKALAVVTDDKVRVRRF